MSRIKAFDAFFLATESRKSPWHMAGCEVFELPAGKRGNGFLDKLEAGMLKNLAAAPFNKVVDDSGLWPRWKEVEPDFDYHFTRQALPAPGNQQQFMSTLEHFCASTLDRNAPLWECLLIEGLENNRFAIAFKVHHAVVDGQGGLKMVLRALSTRASDRKYRALWGDNTDNGAKKRRKKSSKSAERRRVAARSLPDLRGTLKSLRKTDWMQQMRDLSLFRAPATALNKQPESSARRFGVGDLPLDEVRRIAHESGTSVNDVLLCVVDAAVHRYLSESDRTPGTELIAGMPVSTRSEGQDGGNQAGLLTIELGSEKADELARLEAIHANTQRAKSYLRELPSSFLMGYGVAVLGMPVLLQNVPGLIEKRPIINMGVSNVSPPPGSDYLTKDLYLAGAKLVGLYTQPILPPSVLLNVTAASIKGKLCLGIGSTKEAIDQPLVLMDYMTEALQNLADQLAN